MYYIHFPKTFSERRDCEEIIIDDYNDEITIFHIKIRGKRRASALPDDYMMCYRSYRGRTWKNNGYGIKRRRKKQWS